MNLVWKIAGEAGYGIMITGRIFAKACSRSGFNVYGYAEFPSIIRGGHNTYSVRFGNEPVSAPFKSVNLLVALNKEAVEKHQRYLAGNAVLLYDSNEIREEMPFRSGIDAVAIPMQELVSGISGLKIIRNVIALGASAALLGLDLNIVTKTLVSAFEGRHKAGDIIRNNTSAVKLGYDFVREHFKKTHLQLRQSGARRIILDGNDAVALGALKAGCKFYSAYPMTPATSILHSLAAKERDFNLVVKQAEDEISAVHMAIGASYTGVRAMCATSGGGFCLMTEGIGLAGMSETPIVIVNAQRPGPSTGLPTRTEQGDLRFVLHASHGEFPRVVVAPGDVEECFYRTSDAFCLAERYQLPVIILTDKYLANSYVSTKPFDTHNLKLQRFSFADKVKTPYFRYAFAEDGVSPRAVPGQKDALFTASSDEHDAYGFSVEDPDTRLKMMNKRYRKLEALSGEIPEPVLYGDEDADLTIITWGSLKGVVLEAMRMLHPLKINLLHFVFLSPFKAGRLAKVLGKAGKLLLVEQNKTAQLGSLIREHALCDIPDKLLKYDGRQLTPEEVCGKVRSML